MKKEYLTPEMEITEFDNIDVIATSDPVANPTPIVPDPDTGEWFTQ